MNCALQIGWPVAEGWVTCPVTSEQGCAEQHSDQAWWVRAPFHVFGASCFPVRNPGTVGTQRKSTGQMSLKAMSEGPAAARSLGCPFSLPLAHSESMVSKTRLEAFVVTRSSWILLFLRWDCL